MTVDQVLDAVTRPPQFWMNEVSGRLHAAVQAYLEHRDDALTPDAIGYLRAYFRQWVGSDAWDLNPAADDTTRAELAALRAGVDGLTSAAAIDAWLEDADRFGIDPL